MSKGGAGRGRCGEGSSVWINDEAGEGAIFVGVAAMHLSSIQLDEDLIAHIQVQDNAVASVVVVLVCILSNGTGTDLEKNRTTPVQSWRCM